jgi:hypothetical protein
MNENGTNFEGGAPETSAPEVSDEIMKNFEDALFGDADGDTEHEDGGSEDGNAEGKPAGGAGSEETSEGTSEGKEAEGDEADAGKEGDSARKSIEVTFNGKPVTIEEEHIAPLVQKGMNYDHVKSEYDRVLDTIGFFAAQSGMSAPEYLNWLSSNRESIVRENARAAIAAENPDLDEEVISQMAYARIAGNREAEAAGRARAEAARNAARRDRFLEFVRKFPDADPAKLPADVIEAVRNGGDIIEEYSAYRVREAERKLAEAEVKVSAKEKNADNEKKALGSMNTAGGSHDPDEFLAGFNA